MEQHEATKRFYDLVWPHRSDLLRVALILTHSIHEAEDLTQETLLKAFRAIDRFTPGTNAKKWLLRILRNSRIDRIRASAASANNVSLDQFAGDIADDRPGMHEEAEWQNPQEILSQFSDVAVIDALQNLPEEIRWTLLLVDVEQFKNEEAAELLDVPLGTIKSRAHRGRAMLRATLMTVAKEKRMIS